MIIALDFDGTVVTHEYPNVGKDIGAEQVLKELFKQGHHFILYTMRSGKELADAIDWFNNRGIPLYGIQKNPTQHEWTDSSKCYAQLYIDDAALGAPLITDYNKAKRPFINWNKVAEYFNLEIK